MESNQNFIEKIFQNRILLHVLFWLSTLVIFGVYGSAIGWPFLAGVLIKLFFLPIQIAATYYLIYYQVPTFLYNKRYVRFAISFFISILICSTLAHFVEDFGIVKVMSGYSDNLHTAWEIIRNPFANVGYNAEDIYLTVFMVTGLKFMKQRVEAKTQMDILEQEKANAEINLLKAQINPRILSKTLHQLHTLTKEKSDAAPEVVIKLSEMLDYMLYQCNSPKVLVSDEIILIQNYLDLEKLQHGAALQVTFFHHLENKELAITPLLLLSLIESVFTKKGENLPPNAKVEIILQENNDQLDCKILSNLMTLSTIEKTDFKKQLDLLYPNQSKLIINSKGATNVIELMLDLNIEHRVKAN